MSRAAFDPSVTPVLARWSPKKMAVLSIDVEHDYNGDHTDALDRLPDLLDAVRHARLPLTAFVEGRLFESRPDLCARLAEAGADLQLHCYDHREPGDSVESLERGIAAFERFTGARPCGYRAHTYRLTNALFRALVAEGFAWDSSILPGIGLGNHPGKAFRRGDYFTLDGAFGAVPIPVLFLSDKPTDLYRRYALAQKLWRMLPNRVTDRLSPRLCRYLADY